jgi:hypothetical protein
MEEQETEYSEILSPVREVIQRLVVGHQPKAFQISGLRYVSLNDESIEGQVVDVHVSGPNLLIVISSTAELHDLIEQVGGLRTELRGNAETTDGRQIELHDGSISRTEVGSLLEGARSRLTLKFRRWSIEDETQSSVAWIAPVRLPSGAGFDPRPGNLHLYVGDRDQPDWFSTGHLYLEGRNRYIVLRRNERVGRDHEWLVIEPVDNQTPNQEILREEFRLLQFTVGIGAGVGMVRGVTETLESRTALSVSSHGLQKSVPGWAESPVPIKGEVWARPFFRKLSRSLSTLETKQGKSAVHMFLNAFAPLDTDTTIILMATALRTLTYAYVVDRDLISEARLISERQMWREWVQEQRSVISRFGVSDWTTARERIIEASEPQIEDLFSVACEDAGLDVDDRLLQRVSNIYGDYERRGWASEAKDEDFDRLIATANLFVALLGALIGYEGKVGYTRPHGSFFGRVQLGPSRGDREQAQKVFAEQVDLPERDLVTWPDYEVPDLPDHELVNDLAAFAGELRSRTGGVVSGGLEPSLSKTLDKDGDGEESVDHLRFVMRLKDDPSKRIIPFDVQVEDENLLRIEGWHEEDLMIGSVEELREFKRTLADSDRMQRYAQQLLLTHQKMNR